MGSVIAEHESGGIGDDGSRSLEQGVDIRLDLRPVLGLLGEGLQVLERLREAEAIAEQLDDDRRRARVSAFMTNIWSHS